MEKGAASLTAGLLARKGLARPAMRRAAVLGARPVGALDDLGWNDMGEDVPPAAPSPVAKHIAAIQDVMAQRRAEPKVEVKPVARSVPAPKVAPIAKPVAKDRSAAFTLRIDAERHLRLRLLSAVVNQSAQTLLIGALDALIAQHPDIDALAADPKARRGMDDTHTDIGRE